MQSKTIIITILLVVTALLTVAFLPAVQSNQTTTTQPRTLSVNGSALVMVPPDTAYVSVGVHSENKKASEAVAENNRQAKAIVDVLIAEGIAKEDIQTLGFSIFPQDEWNQQGERIGTRFMVDNTVYITVRKVDTIGDILGAVVDAGANNVYGIQFDVLDKTEQIAEARKQAVENAQSQAKDLADAAGVDLGPIQSINYYSAAPMPLYDNKGIGGAAMESVGGVPVSPGQISITADVSLVFEIR